jgi:hypothetical protein
MVTNIRRSNVVFTHLQIIEDKYLRHAAEVAEANAEYERARLLDDAYQVQTATDRLTELKQQRMAMDALVYEQQAQQQRAQPQNRYGLNADEVAVANGIGYGDSKLTNDDRQRIYSEQKGRYQQARRDGSYRDDQGRVSR